MSPAGRRTPGGFHRVLVEIDRVYAQAPRPVRSNRALGSGRPGAGRELAVKKCVAVFDKPINPEEFLAAVDKALGA